MLSDWYIRKPWDPKPIQKRFKTIQILPWIKITIKYKFDYLLIVYNKAGNQNLKNLNLKIKYELKIIRFIRIHFLWNYKKYNRIHSMKHSEFIRIIMLYNFQNNHTDWGKHNQIISSLHFIIINVLKSWETS